MHVFTAGSRPLRAPLLVLLVVGFAVRLIPLFWTGDLRAQIVDEQHYVAIATNLAEGRGFATAAGPTSLRPPLYPAFIAAVWTASGTRSLQFVRVAQIVVALLTTVVIFLAGRELFGERAGLAAAALTCFYPSLLVSNYLMLTEVLFAFLVACAAWAMVRLLNTGSVTAAVASGGLIALAALARSVLYPFSIAVAFLVAAFAPALLIRRLTLGAIVVASWALVLAPWAIRNTRLQRVPVLVDTMGGMNLRMGNYEYTPLDRMWDAVSVRGDKSWIAGLPAAPAGGGDWTEGQKERWARDRAVRFMLDHPMLTFQRAIVKFGDFWALDRDFLAGLQQGLFRPPLVIAVVCSVAVLAAYPLVLFAALGGIARLTRADWPAAWLPLLVVLFVCALHTLVFGHPRYRLPVMPLLCLYAGAALVARRTDGEAHAPRTRWPIGACAAFVALWAVQFAWRDWTYVERIAALTGLR